MDKVNKVAFLFPGQGAQYVGMGKDFYEKFPVSKEIFDQADEILKRPLSKLIFEGPQEELTQTCNSQPSIYVMSLALLAALRQMYPHIEPYACAGLSLGEYTALCAAGKISFEEGLLLVQKRASLMQEACEKNPGSMRVVLGLSEEAIEGVLKPLQSQYSVCVANVNCPGQIVIAGSQEGLDVASDALKQAGAKRVLPLEVSGAFHSDLMQLARQGLTPYLEKAPLQDSKISLVMNTPGEFVEDLSSIRSNLIDQVTQTVRWQKGIETMVQNGTTHFIEVGCGKTLQGMNKRIGINVPTYSVEKVQELEDLSHVAFE